MEEVVEPAVTDPTDPVAATLALLRERAVPCLALSRDSEPVPLPPALGLVPAPATDDDGRQPGLADIPGEDRRRVVLAFQRACSRRLSTVTVTGVEGGLSNLCFVDAREGHGVIVVGLLGDAPMELPIVDAAAGPDEEPRTRVTWARLNGAAEIVEVGPGTAEMLGWTAAELVGQRRLRVLHPDDHDRAIEHWVELLGAPGERRRYRCRHLRADGSYLWVEITNLNRLNDPARADVLSEIVDIADEMAAHEALAQREQLLRQLMDALPVGVVQFAADRSTVHENGQLARLGVASGIEGLLAAAWDEDRTTLEAALDEVAAGCSPAPVEVHLGRVRCCRVTLRPLVGGGGLACVDDVTEAVQLRRELEDRATYDSLTGCLTRAAILESLDAVLGEAPGAGAGVVFVDLDRFKPVNDELGHAAGDELLAEIGARLRAAVRGVDLVGRLGGDEFLVVCPDVTGDEALQAIAERIAMRLSEPVALAGEHLVRPRASIGVAWARPGTSPDALVARADAAMYEAKKARDQVPNTPTKLTISPG